MDLVLLGAAVVIFIGTLTAGVRAQRRQETAWHYYVLAVAMVFTGAARVISIAG